MTDEIPPRHEHKFIVPPRIADALRVVTARHCALDRHAAASPEHRYVITSLYYDTPDLRLWDDGAQGQRSRFKLRVRRYGLRLGDSPVWFEVKHRIGDVVLKRRAMVPAFGWSERLERGADDASDVEQDFRARVLRLRARPTLLVRYAREAWKAEDERYVRVTFDTRLEFARSDAAELDTDLAWESADDAVAFDDDGSLVLVEVKVEEQAPVWLASALRDLGLVRRGFSKYGVGIRRTFGTKGRTDVYRRVPR